MAPAQKTIIPDVLRVVTREGDEPCIPCPPSEGFESLEENILETDSRYQPYSLDLAVDRSLPSVAPLLLCKGGDRSLASLAPLPVYVGGKLRTIRIFFFEVPVRGPKKKIVS